MNILFTGLAGAMVAFAIGFMLWPLLRAKAVAAASRSDHDVSVYKDQLAEITRDRQRGVITEAEAKEAEREVQRRLLAAAEEAERTVAPTARREWITPAAIALVTPAAAVGLYLWLGSPGAPDRPLAERTQEMEQVQHMEAAVLQLAQRLSNDPSDLEGWAMLGRGYMAMNRYADAANAFRQAKERGLDNAEINAALGEALTADNDGVVTASARTAFEQALQQAPREPRSRYYLALASYQAGDPEEAFQEWQALLRESPEDAPWVPLLRQNLTELATELEMPAGSLDLSAAAPRAPSGPSREQVEAIESMTPEEQAAMIEGMVDSLAARLEAEPDNLEGWLRLAQSYLVLGREQEALGALRRAVPLVEALPAGDERRRIVTEGIARLEAAVGQQ